MAAGDITIFNEALVALFNGTHDLDTHDIKLAILDNTTTPTAATATPALGDFTEVGSGGTYVAGGTSLTISLTQTSGVLTFDSTTNPSWAADAGNDVDAYWGLLYNNTDAGKAAIGFIDLGGPIDMTATSIDITFASTGIWTSQQV